MVLDRNKEDKVFYCNNWKQWAKYSVMISASSGGFKKIVGSMLFASSLSVNMELGLGLGLGLELEKRKSDVTSSFRLVNHHERWKLQC